MKNSFHKLLISKREDIHKLERFVEDICEFYNITNEYFGNILLATTESAEVLFAVGLDDNLHNLEVRFEKNPRGLSFKLKLEGSGQVSGEGEDILDKEIRRHRLGRDLYIIRALADEIEISVNARGIRLVFYVTSMNYDKSLERIKLLKSFWEKSQNVMHEK
jgi:hypothetical protein